MIISENTIYDVQHELHKAVEKLPNQSTEDLIIGALEELGEVAQAHQNMKLSPEKGTTVHDLRKEVMHLLVLGFRLADSIGTVNGYLRTDDALEEAYS